MPYRMRRAALPTAACSLLTVASILLVSGYIAQPVPQGAAEQSRTIEDAPLLSQANDADLTGQARISFLIERMTVEEKLGQLHQMAGGRSKNLNSRLGPDEDARVRSGLVGSYLHVAGAEPLERLQRVAVEESRTGIPLLFAMDVVHGYRTIFPVPIALAASFDEGTAQEAARVAGREASAAGLHWTFAPMIDIGRDARWGRVVEGGGEEPYLGARMAVAQVRGYQNDDLSAADTIIATAKHLGAYGAGQGGRDYDSADVSERSLRETYLPPFEAAARAGAGSMMVAFNDIGGVPTTANSALLQGVLREAWGYDGLVVSDWNSVLELTEHGIAADRAEAGALALQAGVDMEMTSGVYVADLAARVAADERLASALDAAVGHVLLAKDRLGLLDDPFKYSDPDTEAAVMLSDEHRAAARRAAVRAAVLLKNDGTLPLNVDSLRRIAVIGELADDPRSPQGSWRGQGRDEDVITILDALEDVLPDDVELTYEPGTGSEGESDERARQRAVKAARRADIVIFVTGEDFDLSGEARSRSEIGLPAPQAELAVALASVKTPLVALLMNGRPLVIDQLAEDANAILETWMLGTETGPAVAGLLLGTDNPGGRLPMSFPRRTGQLPIYMGHYPTGRPADPDLSKDTARYMDVEISPLYPFGHGLSYSTFDYEGAAVDAPRVAQGEMITVSVQVTNTSERPGDEVVQLYVRDPIARVARPVKELRGFARVRLEPGETRSVSFTLSPDQFAYWGPEGDWRVDAGEILWMIGSTSADIRANGSFEIAEGFMAEGSGSALATGVSVSGGSKDSDDGQTIVGGIEILDPRASAILPEGAVVAKLTDDVFGWSEGPVWMEAREQILFTDVPGNTMYGWSERAGLEVVLQPSGAADADPEIFREPGANGLIPAGPDEVLAGDHGNRAIARIDLESGKRVLLTERFEGARYSSPNDLVRAEDGTIYFTDPPYGLKGGDGSPYKEMDANGVYRLSPTGDVSRIEDTLTRPNGVALSPDERTLYVAQSDPEAAHLYAYDLDGDGNPTARRLMLDLTPMVEAGEPGLPDGMAVSAKGHIFLAGPGGIHLLSPEGERLALIRTGTAAANVALTPNEDALYITSGAFLARVKL